MTKLEISSRPRGHEMTRLPCVICGEPADHFALHYTDDGWDPPFHFWLCREHQRALIGGVQEAIKKMRDEREVAHVSNRN